MTCHLPSLPHSTIYYILKDLTHGRVLYYFEREKQNQNEFRGAMNSKRTAIIKFTKANLHLKSQNQILLFFQTAPQPLLFQATKSIDLLLPQHYNYLQFFQITSETMPKHFDSSKSTHNWLETAQKAQNNFPPKFNFYN